MGSSHRSRSALAAGPEALRSPSIGVADAIKGDDSNGRAIMVPLVNANGPGQPQITCEKDGVVLTDDLSPTFTNQEPTGAKIYFVSGAKKVAGGSVGGTAGVAGVEVGDGDWVVGDADGVVVVPRGSVADVLAAGRARADKEHTMFDKLRAGETTITLLGLDPTKVDRG